MNIELTPGFKKIARECYKRKIDHLAKTYVKQAEQNGWNKMAEITVKYHLSDNTTYMDRDLFNYISPVVEEYVNAKKKAKKMVEDLLAA